MYERAFAEKIKEKVEEVKVFLFNKETNFVMGYDKRIYYYDSEETREKHIKSMEDMGWRYDEYSRKNQGLYNRFFDDYRVSVVAATFLRDEESIINAWK